MKNTAEFDSGTLIYIALAIVAAIVSIFQKKNQGKNEPESKRSDWKEIFSDPDEDLKELELDKPKYEPIIETTKPEPILLKKEEQLFRSKSIETYIENEAFVPIEYVYEDVIKKTEIGDSEQNKVTPTLVIDLEKAIIYSEIIQRKF